MKIIESVSIKNYKSFLKDDFSLESLTAIVGANESGKTNSLKAIYELSKDKQSSTFDNGDFRLGSPDFPDGEIVLKFEIILNKFLIPKLSEIEPELTKLKLYISKTGRLKKEPKWSASIESNCLNIKDVILVKNKNEFRKQSKDYLEKNVINDACAEGWMFKDSNMNFTKNPFCNLSKNKHIIKLENEEKIAHLSEVILCELLQYIKILFWRYRDDDYLHDKVPLEEFVSNTKKFSCIDNIFQIAGWKHADYRNYLINYDSTTRNNLLRTAQDEINKLIKKHWTTHNKLSINLSFEGSDLTINLNEPGHVTPPNFRSDGFKWFLTFLLYFKRHAVNSLENHILLVDEPGVFLHPRGQKDVLKELKNISEKNQIIYSTHQTFLIDKNNPDSVRIVKREPRKGIRALYDSRIDTIKNKKNIFSDSLLRESLGFLVSDISPINEKNILVEGGFDRDLLIFVNKYFKIIDLNEISVINCGRATNIKSSALLYLSNDLKVVGLYESDKGGKDAYSNAGNFEKVIFNDFLPNNHETMEDLVPDNIYEEALREWEREFKITSKLSGSRPRIKEINNNLSKDQSVKIDEKHRLEDILLEKIKKDFYDNNDISNYSYFKDVLNFLNKKMNGTV